MEFSRNLLRGQQWGPVEPVVGAALHPTCPTGTPAQEPRSPAAGWSTLSTARGSGAVSGQPPQDSRCHHCNLSRQGHPRKQAQLSADSLAQHCPRGLSPPPPHWETQMPSREQLQEALGWVAASGTAGQHHLPVPSLGQGPPRKQSGLFGFAFEICDQEGGSQVLSPGHECP